MKFELSRLLLYVCVIFKYINNVHYVYDKMQYGYQLNSRNTYLYVLNTYIHPLHPAIHNNTLGAQYVRTRFV